MWDTLYNYKEFLGYVLASIKCSVHLQNSTKPHQSLLQPEIESKKNSIVQKFLLDITMSQSKEILSEIGQEKLSPVLYWLWFLDIENVCVEFLKLPIFLGEEIAKISKQWQNSPRLLKSKNPLNYVRLIISTFIFNFITVLWTK